MADPVARWQKDNGMQQSCVPGPPVRQCCDKRKDSAYAQNFGEFALVIVASLSCTKEHPSRERTYPCHGIYDRIRMKAQIGYDVSKEGLVSGSPPLRWEVSMLVFDSASRNSASHHHHSDAANALRDQIHCTGASEGPSASLVVSRKGV